MERRSLRTFRKGARDEVVIIGEREKRGGRKMSTEAETIIIFMVVSLQERSATPS